MKNLRKVKLKLSLQRCEAGYAVYRLSDLLNLEDRIKNLTLGIEINIEFVMLYWQVSNLENRLGDYVRRLEIEIA